ncbi:hypothetical protein BCR34DRAFT_480788 [Clohesyomyces aquaticus]|uniref:HIT-type domain-containing protein n=1 Tax=Clohesyomyces aquaticus TaxID=1231657 RepID=A0A1Y1ZV37_9PLEO|nr:hypothetical protein BCR34DRAFT_480788 [Clohesyomyces aquaticus]
MASVLCGVCNTEPKKYKCPTCALPYCSLPCFKDHKRIHPSTSTPLSARQPSPPAIPEPPPPPPAPKYIKKKRDFTLLTSNPRYQELLKTHPALLASLQRIYAATIEPEPDDDAQPTARHAQGGRGRGRGRGDRGKGRGGGRFAGQEGRVWKWTQKKGDADAMRLLKRLREGKEGGKEQDAIVEFARMVSETFREGGGDGEGGRMEIG